MLKKFLGIVVLGFLLSGCASQETLQNQRTYSSKAGVELVKKGFNPFFEAYGHSRKEAIQKALDLCEIKRQEIGVGWCRVYWNCRSNMTECAGGSKSFVSRKQKEEKKAQATLADMKSTCKEFGYKEGSEKLADCMKDLYLRNVQAGTAKRKIDPSVWDDLLDISKGMSEGKSLTESLGGVSSSSSSRKITCFKTGEETGGLNKVCRYDCVGNLVTTTVGAAQMCPIQIQR